jgi:Cu/Ag efflux pump CusA
MTDDERAIREMVSLPLTTEISSTPGIMGIRSFSQ